FFIQLVDFFYTVGSQWNPVFLTGIGKPHQLFEDIGFLQVCRSTQRFYPLDVVRDVFKRIHVAVQLIVEATFKLAALASQFERIERQVLIPRRGGRYGLEIRKPRGAAEFTPTG